MGGVLHEHHIRRHIVERDMRTKPLSPLSSLLLASLRGAWRLTTSPEIYFVCDYVLQLFV